MIVDSKKYPFKWMPAIISILEKLDSTSTNNISRKIGSCVADASESLQILSYLTSFGKVIFTSENWELLHSREIELSSINFRFQYIADLDKILHLLQQFPITAAEIATKIEENKDEVFEALNFLAFITKTGYLQSEGEGRNCEWQLKKWPLK